MALIQSVQATQTHNILYRFQCEHCGKASGWLTQEFIGAGEIPAGEIPTDANGRLSEDGMRQARKDAAEAAKANLIRNIKDAIENVQNERYTDFRGLCPHCSKPQTWYVRHSLSRAFFISLTLGLCFPIIPIVLLMVNESPYLVWALYSPIALFLLIFIPWAIHCIVMKIQTRGVVDPQKPFINWNM